MADLDATAAVRAELDDEALLVDLARERRSVVALLDRLRDNVDAPIDLRVTAIGRLRGVLVAAAADAVVLRGHDGRRWLIPVAAVLVVTGPGDRFMSAASAGPIAARLGWRAGLRRLAEAGSDVVVHLRDASTVAGRIVTLRADHLDLLLASDADAGGARVLVPLAAIVAVLA